MTHICPSSSAVILLHLIQGRADLLGAGLLTIAFGTLYISIACGPVKPWEAQNTVRGCWEKAHLPPPASDRR